MAAPAAKHAASRRPGTVLRGGSPTCRAYRGSARPRGGSETHRATLRQPGKRFVLGLAASCLLHASVAGAILRATAEGVRPDPSTAGAANGESLRVVRVAFIPKEARRPLPADSSVAAANPLPLRPAPEKKREEPPLPAVEEPTPVVIAIPDTMPAVVTASPPAPDGVAFQPPVIEIAPVLRGGPDPLATAGPSILSSAGNSSPGSLPSPPSTGPPDPGAAIGLTPRPGPAAERPAVEMLSLPPPEYPPLSRRRGEEGLVLLEAEVLPDGGVGEVRVVQAPEYPRLVAAAIEAVRQARFTPPPPGESAAHPRVQIPVRFQLQ
jgi:periplasmic protein TonB